MNKLKADIQSRPKTESKEYLPKLVEQLEDLIEQDINIPFNLKKIKDKGFSINVRGLYAFLSFDFMPWTYENTDSWEAVFKSIKGKQFYGKVYRLVKDPLFIIFNAQIPQFKTADLIEFEKYKGLVIKKNKRTLFIDVGHHFKWRCGSIVGIMQKSFFSSTEEFDDLQLGDEVEAIYYGQDKYENKQFFADRVKLDWLLHFPQKLIGHTVNAEIIETNKNLKFKLLINDRYTGVLTDLDGKYSHHFRQEFKSAVKDYAIGDMISCKVVGVSTTNQFIKLNLDKEFSFRDIHDNSIANKLDDKVISMLTNANINETTK